MNLPPASRYGGIPMQVEAVEAVEAIEAGRAKGQGQAKEVTETWHDRYLCTTILFFLTTCLFAGLFGGYYSAWSHRPPCEVPDGHLMQWRFGTGPEFDGACHVLYDNALHALEGASCPTDCDAWWHERHPVYSPSSGRRRELSEALQNGQLVTITLSEAQSDYEDDFGVDPPETETDCKPGYSYWYAGDCIPCVGNCPTADDKG